MGEQARTDTSGTQHSGRPSRTLVPSLEVLDVRAEGVGLLAEPQWADGDRNSKTLLKSDGLRIVLTALRAGATMDNDDPDEAVAIHTLQGAVRVRAAGQDVAVGMGELVCLAGGDPWTLTAEGDSLLLVSVGRASSDVPGPSV